MKIVSFLIAFVIFSIVILFHELGHFLLAKANGIRVNEFCFGLGPTICGIQKGETKYCIKAFPFGGACMMEGEDSESQDNKAFNNKSVWARISVVAAGPIFNFIMAFIFSFILVCCTGYDLPVLADVSEGYAAEEAGLQAGDTIFFIADKEDKAAFFAGQIRNELGARLDLIEKNAYRFCYVNDFPMFERDPETKKIGFTHNPFSMPQGGLEALNTMDPLDILAYQYDIVCNGVELSSGAVRNHDMQIMVKAFEIAGYDEEVLKAKFGALYNAFQFGAPPHAGMAPGVDRMIMLLRNEENIREVIPFPMSGTAQDLMCGAPNEVTEQQLREVHIKVRD